MHRQALPDSIICVICFTCFSVQALYTHYINRIETDYSSGAIVQKVKLKF